MDLCGRPVGLLKRGDHARRVYLVCGSDGSLPQTRRDDEFEGWILADDWRG